MALTRFDPPGYLDDLDDLQKGQWSQWVSNQLDEVRARDGAEDGLVNYGPRPQFFNPLKTPPGAGAVTQDITWTAFPRIIQLTSPDGVPRWRKADAGRDAQDEYCEWSVTRDPATQKIVKVTFTSEGPEYWRFLAALDRDLVVRLYQQHVSPDVRPEHLFAHDQYIERNRWNNSTESGAMHLIQRNNTLGAEIELAAAATIVRRRNGVVLTSAQELIECAQYGQAERHSDPKIGAVVNELARGKTDITLANPVGLCIAGLSVAGWETPDGSSALDYWKITRGTADKALRAVYEVPAPRNFVVGDIKINGRKIEYGAQIADFITIKLTGLAARIGQSRVPPVDGCVGRAPGPVRIAAMAAATAATPRASRL
jgi:hypothetical protein